MKVLSPAAGGLLAVLCGASAHSQPAPMTLPPIVELRQYTLHPGKRDVLIDMFDAHFIEPQESAGMDVIGQFRNLDDPNKFVWLRGFSSMDARARGLTQFYYGPVWKAFRNAANETIIDNDNVLLLRPVHSDSSLLIEHDKRAAPGTRGDGKGLIVATIYHLDPTSEKQTHFVAFFERKVAPLLMRAGVPVIAAFVPEPAPNNFPRLPMREGEHVFVWFSRFHDAAEFERSNAALAEMPQWRDSVAVELSAMVREPQTLRLKPTARSLLQD
jgi:NIPSNAP